MSNRAKWTVVAIVGLIFIGITAWGIWFMRNPLSALAGARRRALDKAGFQKVELGSGGERLTAFVAGNGPPLLFLHGTGDQAGTWADVARDFTGSFRVVVVDLPGHGDSDPQNGDLPMATVMAGSERLLAAVTTAASAAAGPAGLLGPPTGVERQPAIVVGNSLGAWLATLLAARHPEQVARLVLVNGGPLFEPGGPSLVPKDRAEAGKLMALLRDPESPPLPGYVLDDVVRRAGRGPIGRLTKDVPGLIAHLLDEAALAKIETPTELLWGASDQLMKPSYAERLLVAMPAARLTLIERCGHLPQVECPRQLASELARLLAAAPPPRRVSEPASDAVQSHADPAETATAPDQGATGEVGIGDGATQ